jgi:predicted Zn-dependent protease
MDKALDQKKEILLIPIGKVLVEVLGEIAVALRKTFRYHVRIGRSEEPANDTYQDPRRQYVAERLLQLAAILGVVDADMFAGEKSFVFGLNQPDRGIGVIALSRLREEFYKKPANSELFQRRAVTESIAQVGRSLGMPVCSNKKCVFSAATGLWRLDEKDQIPDPACQEKLEGLHTRVNAHREEPHRNDPVAPGPAGPSEILAGE